MFVKDLTVAGCPGRRLFTPSKSIPRFITSLLNLLTCRDNGRFPSTVIRRKTFPSVKLIVLLILIQPRAVMLPPIQTVNLLVKPLINPTKFLLFMVIQPLVILNHMFKILFGPKLLVPLNLPFIKNRLTWVVLSVTRLLCFLVPFRWWFVHRFLSLFSILNLILNRFITD